MTPGLFALLGAIPWGEGGLDGWGRRGGVKGGGDNYCVSLRSLCCSG